MQTITKEIKINVYEIGDIIDISRIGTSNHKNTIRDAMRCVVVGVKQMKDGRYGYTVLTDNADKSYLRADELGEEKYVGHIDLSQLFNSANKL